MATARATFPNRTASAWMYWVFEALSVTRRRGPAYLDIRDLSPHLRRDMGLLDGNDPCGRHS